MVFLTDAPTGQLKKVQQDWVRSHQMEPEKLRVKAHRVGEDWVIAYSYVENGCW